MLSCCSASELKCHVSCAKLKYIRLNAQPMGWRILIKKVHILINKVQHLIKQVNI